MAIYRNVQLSFWTDNKVEDEFTPEDKFFYLYLLTNPQTNICGCYEVSYSQMSYQTGYNKDTINRLLERFEKEHNIIRYSKDTKEVLILHWYKYNWSKSEKVLTGVENVAKHIKNNAFKEYVLGVVKSIRDDCSVIGYTYPIQTSVSDTDTDTDTVNNINNINNIDNINIINNNTKKRKTYKDILNELLTEFDVSEKLINSINDWIGYKKERNFTYKERGLRNLLKTISDNAKQYGDDVVINAISESIASGYQGIVWDKVRKSATCKPQPQKQTTKFNNFEQRNYNMSSLEAQLLGVSRKGNG